MNDLQKLEYAGTLIRDRDEMLCLTDMWKADGSNPARRPVEWLRSAQAQRFIETLAGILGFNEVGDSHLVKVGRGGLNEAGKRGGGGTWAHWQIGLSYAQYLSPAFHAWGNTAVRERMMGIRPPARLDNEFAELIRRTDGISRMLSHKVTEVEAAVQSLPALIQTLADQAIAARIDAVVDERMKKQATETGGYNLTRGVTVDHVISEMAGIGDYSGIRGLSQAVSGALTRYHSRKGIHVGYATLGTTSRRIFNVAIVRQWLLPADISQPDRGGEDGRAMIHRRVNEKRGQGTLGVITNFKSRKRQP